MAGEKEGGPAEMEPITSAGDDSLTLKSKLFPLRYRLQPFLALLGGGLQ